MSKLHNSGLRKGIFAVAAVALVSTTGGVAFAHGKVPGIGKLVGQVNSAVTSHHGDGYGNDPKRATEARNLFQRLARANYEYDHTALHSFWRVAQDLTPSQYIKFQAAAAKYQSSTASAQGQFLVAVNTAVATTRTDAQFNAAFNAAQNNYGGAITAATNTFLSTLAAKGVPQGGIADDLREAKAVLSAYLDLAQAKFVQNTGTDERPGRGKGSDSLSAAPVNAGADDSQREKVGKYNQDGRELKVAKPQQDQDR